MRGVSAIFVGSKRWVTAAILASAVTFGSARAFDRGQPASATVVTTRSQLSSPRHCRPIRARRIQIRPRRARRRNRRR